MGRLERKKVLVTGASGFIGSNLTRLLLEEGAQITVVSRYNSLEHNVRLAPYWDRLEVLEADIRHGESLKPLSQRQFDYVFHLAAYNHVGNSFLHVEEALATNALGSANLLEAVEGYERLVYISTSEVYGFQTSVPFVETMFPRPQSPYSVGKYAGELYALMKQREAGRPIVVLRPFNAFGPGQSTRALIPELIVKCLREVPVLTTEGRQTREFTYVTDLTEGMVMAALSKEAEGQVMNLGMGRDIAIREVARLVHEKTGGRSDLQIGALPTRPNEIWQMRSDANRAKELLGWEAKVSFEEGLDRTIAWFREYLPVYYDPESVLLKLNRG